MRNIVMLLMAIGIMASTGNTDVMAAANAHKTESTKTESTKTESTKTDNKDKDKEKEDKSDKDESKKEVSLKEYFPADVGYKWEYEGEGMEFAGFKMEVIYKDGDRFQVKKENSGTVVSAVYEVTDTEMKMVFSKPESYDDTDYLDKTEMEVILLKAPIEVGNTWKDEDTTYEIVDTDATVETEKETFQGVIKVKETRGDSVFYTYYKEGIGMVKKEMTGEFPITETLITYSFEKPE